MDNIKDIVETTLKAEIVKALNAAPEAIEKLVKAALYYEVNERGGEPSYHSQKRMPYLDYLVGDEIRMAARLAVQQVIEENKSLIHDAVKKCMSADDMVDSFAKHIIKSADEEWRININFEAEK